MSNRKRNVLDKIKNGDITVIMYINAVGNKCFKDITGNYSTLYLTLTCRALLQDDLIYPVPHEQGLLMRASIG